MREPDEDGLRALHDREAGWKLQHAAHSADGQRAQCRLQIRAKLGQCDRTDQATLGSGRIERFCLRELREVGAVLQLLEYLRRLAGAADDDETERDWRIGRAGLHGLGGVQTESE